MLKMHLKQTSVFSKPGCIYSACGLFSKNEQRIQKKLKKEEIRDKVGKIN